MAIIKESTNNDVGEFVEKKYNLVQPQWKTVWRFLKKNENRATIQSNNLTTGHVSRKDKKIHTP